MGAREIDECGRSQHVLAVEDRTVEACVDLVPSWLDLRQGAAEGQIHRWDPTTSDEETLSALTDLQRAGRIRCFGSSTFPAHRIVQAEWTAREHRLSRSVTKHPGYSILQRGIGTQVLPVTELGDDRVPVHRAGPVRR